MSYLERSRRIQGTERFIERLEKIFIYNYYRKRKQLRGAFFDYVGKSSPLSVLREQGSQHCFAVSICQKSRPLEKSLLMENRLRLQMRMSRLSGAKWEWCSSLLTCSTICPLSKTSWWLKSICCTAPNRKYRTAECPAIYYWIRRRTIVGNHSFANARGY